MLEKTGEEIRNQERYNEIIQRVGPHAMYMLDQFKTVLGGKLPLELTYGMVAGYLHGKGFNWEESFVGMNRFIQVAESLLKPEQMDGEMTIIGSEDGTAKLN